MHLLDINKNYETDARIEVCVVSFMLSQAGALLVKKNLRKIKNYDYEPRRELLVRT